MINSVFLYGKLDGKIRNQNLRKFICQKLNPDDNSGATDVYLITNWTRDDNSRIMTLPIGKNVVIKGRLETNPTYGVIIVVEDHQLIK